MVQRLKPQRLGQLQGSAGTHSQVAREHQQCLLVLVLSSEKCLLVIGELDLCAEKINAGRHSRVVLAFGELIERLGVGYTSLRGICASGSRLRIQIETCDRADDEIPSILVIQFARPYCLLTRLVVAKALQID